MGILDSLSKKQLKPRGFRYKPRYYDADKEEFKSYVEKLRAERDANDKGVYTRTDFKGKFTSQRKKGSEEQRKLAFYNLKLLIILIGICIIAYYLFQTGAISKGLNKFMEIFKNKDGLY